MYKEIFKDKKIIAAQENIKERDYWCKKLSGDTVTSRFPFAKKKSGLSLGESRIKTVNFRIDGELFSKLAEVNKGSDYKLHIILMAGLFVLLDKYNLDGNKDIMIATPIYKPQIEGEFINTVLPLRMQQNSNMPFREILKEVGKTIIEAAENQNYPVELLFDPLNNPVTGTEFTPVDTAVLLESIHDKRHIRPVNPSMVFSFQRTETYVDGTLEYNSDIYEKVTVLPIVNHFIQLLETVIFNLDIPVSDVEVLSEEEKNRILSDFNKIEVEDSDITRDSYISPRTTVEKKLETIWSEVLEIENSSFGIDNSFFELDGNSLKTIMLISRIFKEFEVRIPLAEVFKSSTIRGLAEYIEGAVKNEYSSIDPVEEREYYLISSEQKHLYIIQQFNLQNVSYNVPSLDLLELDPDRERLHESFRKLIRRHESFRTSFHVIGNKIMQKMHDPGTIEFELEYYEISQQKEMEQIVSNFVKPFDLSTPPLLRAGVIKLKKAAYLIWDTHHIVLDLVSNVIFRNDLMELYNGGELPPLKLQYKDYSEWQKNDTQREAKKKQEDYWLEIFKGKVPVLNIPTDYPRPDWRTYEGRRIDFQLRDEEIEALNKMALNEGVTMFMLLLAIFNIMLSKISGQEDIILGTALVGRRHEDWEQIIGMFVNTLALRNHPEGSKTFTEFLHEVKENTLQAFENQDYYFEDLVDQLKIDRTTNRNPIFDIMFNIGDLDIGSREKPGEKIFVPEQENYRYENRTSKFDMTLFYLAKEEKFVIEYSTELFEEKTIREFIDYFKEVVSSVLEHQMIKINDIKITHYLLETDSISPQMEFEL